MHLDWKVTVPCNTTALVVLPTTDERAVRERGVTLVGREANATIWRVPSGNYRFTVALDPAVRKNRNGLLCEEFLYEKTSFPECHSATIAETSDGDLVTAFSVEPKNAIRMSASGFAASRKALTVGQSRYGWRTV